MLRIVRDCYAPIERGARDRKILQAAAHKTGDFIHALLWQHEIRHIAVKLEKPVGKGGESEKVTLLLDPFDRCPLRADASPIFIEARLALVVIGLVAYRIPAGIFVEIDIACRP